MELDFTVGGRSQLKSAVKLTINSAEVFAPDSDFEKVTQGWITRWDNSQTEAMADFVNFVIKCTGCNLQVDVHDIEDPDNAVGKLTDLQEEYQRQKPADYPLISKAKGMASFRSIMIDFTETFIQTCHSTGRLYSDLSIIENIEIWVSTMSSSAIRPFRHTATLLSLAIGNALCRVAATLAENNAQTLRQKEGEQKKKSVNKSRVKEFDGRIADLDRKYAQTKESLQAIFDTVYIHRYRDVDPKIRVDCVSALGNWISTLPDVFFEGMYLRYLGWVLSDLSAPTRAEVIKQLIKLYKKKDNVARLRTFTERFRGRLVEIAMRDSEVSIRASAVELLGLIRGTELLEPDDIDNIGRLVFDTEPRVRKAVAGFFAENIKDLYESTLDEFGGQDGLNEVLGEEVEDDYDAPKSSWLTFKCIAEAVETYDGEDDDGASSEQDENGKFNAGGDSRFLLAAQTIYDGIPEAKEWEVLAGYLLYDFSTTGRAKEAANTAFKQRCHLSEKEQVFLLELLNVSVKGRLLAAIDLETDKKGKSTKQKKDESTQIQETTALHLAEVIPKLLKKYGSRSTTASAVLRLGSTLNLEIFQELRQDSTMYAALLDDFNRQFLSHTNREVLSEATAALLHAREFDDLAEVTESKAQELWDDTINSLRSLISQGTGSHSSEIRDTVTRMAYLAGVADCVSVLEAPGRGGKGRKSAVPAHSATPLTLLLELIRDPELDQAASGAPEVLINAMKTILLYYMWTTLDIKAQLEAKKPVKELPDFSTYSNAIIHLAETWPALSTVRLAACNTLLDLHTLFAQFRHQPPPTSLTIPHIPPAASKTILSTHSAHEKSFAKIARKTLEDPLIVDDAPAGTNDDNNEDAELPESDDESDEEDPVPAKNRKRQTLLAEKNLCELSSKMVLAIIGRVLDQDGAYKGRVKARLQHNRARLGGNYKEVVAYLDGPKVKAQRKKVPVKKTPAAASNIKSAEEVQDEDEEEEGEGVEEGGEEDLRDRELEEDPIVDLDLGEDGEDGGEGEDDIMGD